MSGPQPPQPQHLLTCEACGARVPALRRGRCPFCYLRWTDMRPVGLGAACLVCGERRRDNLRSVEFQRKWIPLCHTCSTRTFQLQPIPRTIEAVRQRLSRDRRWQERRVGRADQRFYPSNRRGGDRRQRTGMNGEYIDASELVVEIIDEGGVNEGLTYNNDATRIALDDDQELFEGRDELFMAERPAKVRAEVTGPHLTPRD